MPKRFDTNQLDPEFPEKAAEEARTTPLFVAPGEPTRRSSYATAEFPSPEGVEDATRRFDEREFGHLDAAFHQPLDRPTYNAVRATAYDLGGERKVGSTGLPEKWLIGLPYLPFSIGLIAGLIELLVIPKHENMVRFHAAQGLAAHVGILIATTILGIAGKFSDMAQLVSLIFGAITTVMLIVFAIKAWRGKPVHIESIEHLTNWLEEKIGPIK